MAGALILQNRCCSPAMNEPSQQPCSPPLQESSLAGLPSDVLHALCIAVQRDAVTTQQMREVMGMLKKLPPGMLPSFPQPAFHSLRLCCKALRSANDTVRTSIRFKVEDLVQVEPYLRKLPSLSMVALDCDASSHDEGDFGVNECLCTLHSIVPRLEGLALRCAKYKV